MVREQIVFLEMFGQIEAQKEKERKGALSEHYKAIDSSMDEEWSKMVELTASRY